MSLTRPLITILAVTIVAATAAAEQSPVLDIDRLFESPDLNGPAPKSVRFSPDSQRVTFLRGKASDRLQQDLWEYHIADDEIRLLVDSLDLVAGTEELSEEEAARRERLRIVGQRGIVAYEFSPDGAALLFPLSGDLYLHEIATGETRRLTETAAGETDPKFSATGKYVSFVRDQDLYFIDLESGREQRLTHDGGGLIRNGMAEFIAQEEMRRYTGYWWSPDDSKIAYVRVDESPVEVADRFEVLADEFKVYQQRYPATGTANALVRLGVIEVDSDHTRWMDLGDNDDIYLARVDWFPDSRHLAVQRQSRNQQRLDLLKVDSDGGDAKILLTETSDTWIDLHDELTFLETRPAFVWASDRSGFRHLYLYDYDGDLIRPLTMGSWSVVPSGRDSPALLHVDEQRGKIYFTATLASPTERHIYSVPLDEAGDPLRLSDRPGWHRAVFADNGDLYVDRFDSTTTPPQVAVHQADGSRVKFIEENALDPSHPYYPYLPGQPTTEFGVIAAEDGQPLHYWIKKPANFDPAKRYPVVVFVYGGPTSQTVTNRWRANFVEVLVRNGYIAFSLDNRGTPARGVKFAAPLYYRLGDVEVIDQVRGVAHLRSLPFVDADRIGIFGWSYGGYMALMGLFRAPDAFAAGVSGAPVTDWALYDTHYTERYLGTPQANAEGYVASSVFPYVGGLTKPLLLIHGMADDNVLFTNSTKLLKAMQDEGLDFDTMMYPGSKHALLRVPSTGRHGYSKILRFFDQHLKK